MSYIYGAPSKARNLTSYIKGRDFLLGILVLEPRISLIHAWKANKYANYSFSLLIMYGSSYMFRHYIAISRESY
jgi:acyl CoA:acetate/3-ketoacid CoA transferase alpha subunit